MEQDYPFNGNKIKFIFLAGAGASCDLGYPSLDNLMQQAIIGNDEIADLIRRVRDSINVKKFGTAEFEEIIVKIKDYIRISSLLRSDYVLREEIRQISNDILQGKVEVKFSRALIKCYDILVKSYGPNIINRNSKEFDFLKNLFLAIAKSSPAFHIYTTNYDCTYQVLASNCHDLSFMSHINNQNGDFQEMAWYNIRKDLTDKRLPEIFIHRLHGCVAWYNNCDYDGGTGCTSEKLGSGGDSEMVVPEEQLSTMCIKLVASQLLGTNRTFASAFDEFSQHLITTKILIVWGYSFRDLEVTRQINQALLSRNTPFKIYYIDLYLTEYAAKNNILKTLKNAPIQISEHFEPRQIRWTPHDGYEELIKKLLKIIEEAGV
jgi:hypothetical protein